MLLRLTRNPYEEPYHLNLEIELSNSRQKGCLEYYCNTTDLTDIGSVLIDFPFGGQKEYIYELGSENPEDNWAHHLRLRFFMIRSVGDVGIEVRSVSYTHLTLPTIA